MANASSTEYHHGLYDDIDLEVGLVSAVKKAESTFYQSMQLLSNMRHLIEPSFYQEIIDTLSGAADHIGLLLINQDNTTSFVEINKCKLVTRVYKNFVSAFKRYILDESSLFFYSVVNLLLVTIYGRICGEMCKQFPVLENFDEERLYDTEDDFADYDPSEYDDVFEADGVNAGR